jgi:hypothetical protein
MKDLEKIRTIAEDLAQNAGRHYDRRQGRRILDILDSLPPIHFDVVEGEDQDEENQ